ncbi:MarR family transcriptional regulator [Solirubrobacter sp. CPCC 204708]|uniref:Helix-turn-helix domain-containing GNAT family N-acetyltransferase n=1 Tax=Solirubrobacter deserti TaxID=2282478 RepID=A0ABT4RPS4_9ACTN|nr:helix-turn-helix domain-containing GNAT family N-acetyltransferase [Solirubrobacter deserti]MBE2316623.1 MarR family transcriptional regulator [Solirubrobacter deserti]MDA0140521.1 helix-turn-helix domain-containing GNAT family N-acetyltransferase [Solirubrobacter deserti]
MATTEHVEAVRAFNRFYTAKMGLTRGSYARPLPEVRVLYELGQGTEEVAALKQALRIDAGQLSRVIAKLEEQGLASRHVSPADARRQLVRLTDKGRERFAQMDAESAQQVGAVLDELGDAAGVVEAMRSLQSAIEPQGTLTLRDPEPGDLGWMVQRHGELYGREYGYDQSFERLVARIAADFDPATDRAWIATIDGERVGAILCVHVDAATAKLRTLLVEPKARGKGVGGALVGQVVRHARTRGYRTLTLYTNAHLHSARRLYERAGFTLTHEEPENAFGHEHVAQTWSLTLNP